MTELTKDRILFTRGQDGVLIPQDVVLKSLPGEPTVKIVPITRGKLQELIKMAQSTDTEENKKADVELLKNGLVSPKLTDEEIEYVKPIELKAICQAILSLSSGVPEDEINSRAQDFIASQEVMLKKK